MTGKSDTNHKNGAFIFVTVWFEAAAYALPLFSILIMLFSFGLYWRSKTQEAKKGTEALSHYLNKIMEGQYDTMMQQYGAVRLPLEDSIYKAVVLLREEREQARRARQNLADNLADLSHQLKTPAASIGLTLALLKNQVWDGRVMEDIRRMDGQVARLQQLVGSMLTLSRLDAGMLVLEHKEFDLEEMLEDAVQPLVQQMEEKEIRFEIRCADGIMLTGDFGWCSEAFVNIIKNCMEHTPKQGSISITCQDNPIYAKVIIICLSRIVMPGIGMPCMKRT